MKNSHKHLWRCEIPFFFVIWRVGDDFLRGRTSNGSSTASSRRPSEDLWDGQFRGLRLHNTDAEWFQLILGEFLDDFS